jgi:hypothetical protein
MPRPPRFTVLSLALASLAFASIAFAAAFDVNLGFASLPPVQGWTYTPSGAHAGVLEANVFSVAGGVLTMNSMGQSNGVSGGSILYLTTPGVTTTENKSIRARVRCLQVEGSANAPAGQGGLFFGFTTGSTQYGFSLTDTHVYVLGGAGFVQVGGTFDNSTAFHDWQFDWNVGGTYSIRRDAVLVGSSSGGFAVAANRLVFGDGTGGANANAQITSLRWLQGSATATAASSWGRVKSLYRSR